MEEKLAESGKDYSQIEFDKDLCMSNDSFPTFLSTRKLVRKAKNAVISPLCLQKTDADPYLALVRYQGYVATPFRTKQKMNRNLGEVSMVQESTPAGTPLQTLKRSPMAYKNYANVYCSSQTSYKKSSAYQLPTSNMHSVNTELQPRPSFSRLPKAQNIQKATGITDPDTHSQNDAVPAFNLLDFQGKSLLAEKKQAKYICSSPLAKDAKLHSHIAKYNVREKSKRSMSKVKLNFVAPRKSLCHTKLESSGDRIVSSLNVSNFQSQTSKIGGCGLIGATSSWKPDVKSDLQQAGSPRLIAKNFLESSSPRRRPSMIPTRTGTYRKSLP